MREVQNFIKEIEVDLVLVPKSTRDLRYHLKSTQVQTDDLVGPDVREVFSSASDNGGRLNESMKDFPHFDFSRIKDPDAWYIHSIKNEAVRKELQGQLEESTEENRNERAREVMLAYLKEHALKNNSSSLSDFPAQKKNLR